MSTLSPRKSWYNKWLPFTAQASGPKIASVYLHPDEGHKSGLIVTPIELPYKSSADDVKPPVPTRLSSYETDLSTPSCSTSSHDSQLAAIHPTDVPALPSQRIPPLHISASGHRELTPAERAKRAELIQALASDQVLTADAVVSPLSPRRSRKLRKSPPPVAGLQRSATLFQLSNLARSRSTTHIPEGRPASGYFDEIPPVPPLPSYVPNSSRSTINLNDDTPNGGRDDLTPIPSSPSTVSARTSVYSNTPLIRHSTVSVVQRQYPPTETPKSSPRKLSKRRPPPPTTAPLVEPRAINTSVPPRLELPHLISEPPPKTPQKSAREYWMQRRARSESGHGSGFGVGGDLPMTLEEGDDSEENSSRAASPLGEIGVRDAEFWGPADSLRNQSHRYPPINRGASVLPVQLPASPSSPALNTVSEYPPIIPASAPPRLRPILARSDTDRSRRWTLAGSSAREDEVPPLSPSDASDAIYMKSSPSIAVPYDSSTSRAFMTIHELHSTECKYRDALLQLQRGETLPPGPPALVHAYLPALIQASGSFIDSLERGAGFTVRGAASAFSLFEQQFESAAVAWCGIVGQLFAGNAPAPATSRRFSSFGSSNLSQAPPLPKSTSTDSIKRPGVGLRMPYRSKTLGEAAWRKSMPELSARNNARKASETKVRLPTARDLAIQPTQRVTRYVLFFRELVAQAADSEDDRAILQQALDAAMRIADKCNRAQDNASFLQGAPPSTPRKLIREIRSRNFTPPSIHL